jgi:hypothetical protein
MTFSATGSAEAIEFRLLDPTPEIGVLTVPS